MDVGSEEVHQRLGDAATNGTPGVHRPISGEPMAELDGSDDSDEGWSLARKEVIRAHRIWMRRQWEARQAKLHRAFAYPVVAR